MQKGKDSHGYTAPIPQSWLLEKEYRIWEQMDAGVRRQRLDEMAARLASGDVPRAFTGDSRLKLTSEELHLVGDFAHKLEEGRRQYYDTKSKSLLEYLGVKGVTEAKELQSRLGRRTRIPFSVTRYQKKLPYLDPETTVVLPPAHLFLRGLVRGFISYGVGKLQGWGTPAEHSGEDPMLLSRVAIDKIKVLARTELLCSKKIGDEVSTSGVYVMSFPSEVAASLACAG
jgi:hypothetical protein